MASVTLAEAQKLGLDDLVTGVIENIVEVNPMYRVLPFQDIMGNAKTYNRENALGDTQVVGIDGTITAKSAATYTKVTTNLTTILGDAEVNGLLQAQRVGGDIAAYQIASKAKNVGRHYQWLLFEGESNGASAGTLSDPASPKFAADDDEFDGLRALLTDIGGDQVLDMGGIPFTFEKLDELLHSVKSKDGQVDALVMSPRDIRKLRTLERALGGAYIGEVKMDSIVMPTYAGVPIFRSDYIPTDLAGSGSPGSGAHSNIYAVNFDDGSETVGVAGLTAATNMGVHVQAVGAAETKDNDIWRVKFYCSLALYSALGAAMITNVDAA